MIIDLDASCYNALVRTIIECLKFSPLMKALTMIDKVPLVHLSRAFSTVIYNKQEEIINFKVDNHKTSINKPYFCKMLGLASSEASVDP